MPFFRIVVVWRLQLGDVWFSGTRRLCEESDVMSEKQVTKNKNFQIPETHLHDNMKLMFKFLQHRTIRVKYTYEQSILETSEQD
jgi:hypothetical protein